MGQLNKKTQKKRPLKGASDWRCQFGTSNSEKIGFKVKEPKAVYGKGCKMK